MAGRSLHPVVIAVPFALDVVFLFEGRVDAGEAIVTWPVRPAYFMAGGEVSRATTLTGAPSRIIVVALPSL